MDGSATTGYLHVTLGHAARSILLLRDQHCDCVLQVMAQEYDGASLRGTGELLGYPTVSTLNCLLLRIKYHSIVSCRCCFFLQLHLKCIDLPSQILPFL